MIGEGGVRPPRVLPAVYFAVMINLTPTVLKSRMPSRGNKVYINITITASIDAYQVTKMPHLDVGLHKTKITAWYRKLESWTAAKAISALCECIYNVYLCQYSTGNIWEMTVKRTEWVDDIMAINDNILSHQLSCNGLSMQTVSFIQQWQYKWLICVIMLYVCHHQTLILR